jgi:DNA-binding CsgD family transcriptional regulator
MDELAYALQMDPLALRLKNYTDHDAAKDLPYSTKELRACYEQGAARFGWSKRPLAPRSMKEGTELVGWGMATGQWDAMQMFARAKGLTRSEQAVLTQLCAGHRADEIACLHGVRLSTVRTHIKNVRQKTGSTSIREIVHRVTRMPQVVSALRLVAHE